MKAADLDRIESTLRIELPEAYRSAMLRFSVPACVGNTDTYLWDDADRLISENLALRDGSDGNVKPWPPRFYCLGRAGGGDVYAIDLESPDHAVWWVDHSHLDNPSSAATGDTFTAWHDRLVADIRADLDGDGIDPDGSPEARSRAEAENSRGGCMVLLLVLFLAVVVALLIRLFGWA